MPSTFVPEAARARWPAHEIARREPLLSHHRLALLKCAVSMAIAYGMRARFWHSFEDCRREQGSD
eukprot:3741027-Rhodomonas_salina.2